MLKPRFELEKYLLLFLNCVYFRVIPLQAKRVGSVVYFNQQTHAFAWSKMMKNIWKLPFPSCIWEAHERLMKKIKKKVCWSAIGSYSQKLVAHLTFFLFFFLHEPLMCMTQNVFWKLKKRLFDLSSNQNQKPFKKSLQLWLLELLLKAVFSLKKTNLCYNSVKCKSNFIELIHKVIKSAPKHKR